MTRKSDDTEWIEELALVCADSFLRTAESFIDTKKIRRELPEEPVFMEWELTDTPYGSALGDLAMCATNLAFAIEIYLKCLRAQLGLPVRAQGRGHDLWQLYKGLPAGVKRDIEERYEKGRTTPRPINDHTTFSLSRRPDTPTWPDLSQMSMQIEEVLKRSKDVFVSWRYVFEVGKVEDDNSHQMHTFEYALLLLACHAISTAILRKSTAKLRNWYTPPLEGQNGRRARMVLNDRDFAKVSSDGFSAAVTVTDQYTGKRYRICNIDGEHIAKELS